MLLFSPLFPACLTNLVLALKIRHIKPSCPPACHPALLFAALSKTPTWWNAIASRWSSVPALVGTTGGKLEGSFSPGIDCFPHLSFLYLQLQENVCELASTVQAKIFVLVYDAGFLFRSLCLAFHRHVIAVN